MLRFFRFSPLGLMPLLMMILGGASAPAVMAQADCVETCQYFDDFTGECLYRIQCEREEDCMTETRCEHWDSFDRRCLSERRNIACEYRTGRRWETLSCSERCQFFDDFERRCLYMTKCAFDDRCVTRTDCERWDDFARQCQSERRQFDCIRGL